MLLKTEIKPSNLVLKHRYECEFGTKYEAT